MAIPQIPDFTAQLNEWEPQLRVLRQNPLLVESNFISFSKEHGIPVDGVITGTPGELKRYDWITCDGTSGDDLFFHPFRIYPLITALRRCNFSIQLSTLIRSEEFRDVNELLPDVEHLKAATQYSDRIVNLSILLEPLYWPKITGQTTFPFGLEEKERRELIEQHRGKIVPLLRELDPATWTEVHRHLRFDSAGVDDNRELYLLLRLGSWSRRKELKGKIAGALWLRHIAEVLRNAFEEIHGVKWEEEDQAYGVWFPGARLVRYGSERPLDDVARSRPHLAWNYGLLTGSVARWYVEGDTEFYAILHVLPNLEDSHIELINLRGNIASERDNIALKLSELLVSDKAHRRFSIISLDGDVANNVKFISRQISQNKIVGYIAMHDPDFEFANFAIEELVEVATTLDVNGKDDSDLLKSADWSNVKSGKDFETKYKSLSSRTPRSLKGKRWGEALAEYACKNPLNRAGIERPFWREIRAALQTRIADYDLHRDERGFDPNTFGLIDLRPSAPDESKGNSPSG